MNRLSIDPRALAAGLALLAVSAGGLWTWASQSESPAATTAPASDPARLSADQIRRLGIRLETARVATEVPLATVPGMVTLPPEARVAVTAPFAGTALQVLVVPGQQVARGAALAVVRAPETVQFGAALARADADLGLARARAVRLGTLAREGLIAGARADEARAALRSAEATARENRRLLALGGATADGTVTLRAPISGRVASVTIDPGAPVGGGATAPFVIENGAALALDLQVPERLAGQVRPGMSVAIQGPAPDAPVATGRIVTVAPSLDPQTRSVLARATLGSATGLVPGRGVTAVIAGAAEAGRQGVAVPSAAVTRIGDADHVFVHVAGRFTPRKVMVAADNAGRAILSAGLRAGESVAVSGVAELKSLLAGR